MKKVYCGKCRHFGGYVDCNHLSVCKQVYTYKEQIRMSGDASVINKNNDCKLFSYHILKIIVKYIAPPIRARKMYSATPIVTRLSNLVMKLLRIRITSNNKPNSSNVMK